MDILDVTEPLDRVVCYCARCRAVLYSFTNLWISIENYICPIACPRSFTNAYIAHAGFPTIIYTGPARIGKERTFLEDCHVHDISCLACQTVLGFKCLLTPANHVLREGQMFFRSSSIVLILANGTEADANPETGEIVGAVIQQMICLETPCLSPDPSLTPSSPESNTHASTSKSDLSIIQGQVLDHLQAQLDASREELQGFDRSRHQQDRARAGFVYTTTPCAQDKVAERTKEVDEESKGVVDKYSGDADMQDIIASLKTEFSEMNLTSTLIGRELTCARQITADLRLSLSNNRHISASTTEQPPPPPPPPQREIATSDTSPAQQDLGRVREEVHGTTGVIREYISSVKACAEEVSLLRAELEGLRDELAYNGSRQPLPEDKDSQVESTNGNAHH
ncbi:hypothetical protein F4813DRAFT_316476 [Daldinia decipiens]|uniref:uncharacterized protein n=1 Tax=Daldinia decipiens TaxID=326647 RepID=UPI0020C29BDC|nr:uncharacterized protein F4813DRAFT_316476 [Daldinia decipiens]KAI1660206.1 hypothetical protein F4813DRAFT_316476 [Daldinia decipiens]